MRALWKAYGKPEIAYTIPDLEKTLASLTKSPAFATSFFKKYIYGTEKNDYAQLLLNAGLVLRKANPGQAYSGFGNIGAIDDKIILSQTLVGTPAYKAGLDIGDVLLTIDGIKVKNVMEVVKITGDHKPGDTLDITYHHL
jgi:predicted metalloprotease with PDZ domain